MSFVKTNPVELLVVARQQLENVRTLLAEAKPLAQKSKAVYEENEFVLNFRALKKEAEFYTAEVRRLGMEAWVLNADYNPIPGVQIQKGQELKVVDSKRLLEWAKENLPKAVITNIDFPIIAKYASLVEEEPDGAEFVDTFKVIIRKLPEKEVE